jgi:VanZ family protein
MQLTQFRGDGGVNDVRPFNPETTLCNSEQVEIGCVVAYLAEMIQRVSIVTGWLVLAFIVYATLSPINNRPVLAGLQLEHFAAFALLGLAFGLAYPKRAFLVAAIVVGSAFGLEALQLLTPDRHGRLIDALVKAAGGICGIGLGQIAPLVLRAQIDRIR